MAWFWLPGDGGWLARAVVFGVSIWVVSLVPGLLGSGAGFWVLGFGTTTNSRVGLGLGLHITPLLGCCGRRRVNPGLGDCGWGHGGHVDGAWLGFFGVADAGDGHGERGERRGVSERGVGFLAGRVDGAARIHVLRHTYRQADIHIQAYLPTCQDAAEYSVRTLADTTYTWQNRKGIRGRVLYYSSVSRGWRRSPCPDGVATSSTVEGGGAEEEDARTLRAGCGGGFAWGLAQLGLGCCGMGFEGGAAGRLSSVGCCFG